MDLIEMACAGLMVWLIGRSFIDAFFDRKEEIINNMINNSIKGDE